MDLLAANGTDPLLDVRQIGIPRAAESITKSRHNGDSSFCPLLTLRGLLSRF